MVLGVNLVISSSIAISLRSRLQMKSLTPRFICLKFSVPLQLPHHNLSPPPPPPPPPQLVLSLGLMARIISTQEAVHEEEWQENPAQKEVLYNLNSVSNVRSNLTSKCDSRNKTNRKSKELKTAMLNSMLVFVCNSLFNLSWSL